VIIADAFALELNPQIIDHGVYVYHHYIHISFSPFSFPDWEGRRDIQTLFFSRLGMPSLREGIPKREKKSACI